MHVISRDSPCYFLTSVAKDRLPVFRTDAIKDIACKALDEAHKSGKFALYAYVIMPDHLHVITDSARSCADTLRFINGIMSHRVIAHLKEKGHEVSLLKLRRDTKRKNYRHSLWDHHPNVRAADGKYADGACALPSPESRSGWAGQTWRGLALFQRAVLEWEAA
jgi:REP element-mobilizing transposase RayT